MDINNRKVVITGMGIVSCLGDNVDDFWTNLLNGRSGIDYLKQVVTEGYSCKIGGEVWNFEPSKFMEAKKAKMFYAGWIHVGFCLTL